MKCQRCHLDEDQPEHGLGGSTRGGQVKPVERDKDQGECVRKDQDEVQPGFRVFSEPSVELPDWALTGVT